MQLRIENGLLHYVETEVYIYVLKSCLPGITTWLKTY